VASLDHVSHSHAGDGLRLAANLARLRRDVARVELGREGWLAEGNAEEATRLASLVFITSREARGAVVKYLA
jgi:hypothetical protein